jgi:hypothetical protein
MSSIGSSKAAALLSALAAAWIGAVAAGVPAIAAAQFPDLQSESECPGCAATVVARDERAAIATAMADAALERFSGTWSSALTSADDPAWAIEDFYCAAGCAPEARERAAAALAVQANAQRPTTAIFAELAAEDARLGRAAPKVTFSCSTPEFAEQILSVPPISIAGAHGGIAFRYEQFGAVREISFDASASRASPALGESTARVEHGSLVIETRGIRLRGEAARAIERYRVSDDGRQLDLTLEITRDLHEPLVLVKRWLRTAGGTLQRQGCDVMTAGLDATLADFTDPAKLDARRRGAVETVTLRSISAARRPYRYSTTASTIECCERVGITRSRRNPAPLSSAAYSWAVRSRPPVIASMMTSSVFPK